jgi:hypothetical protein
MPGIDSHSLLNRDTTACQKMAILLAHDLLAPIYGWFTEGFDMADLQEARHCWRRCEHSVTNAARLTGPWEPGTVQDGQRASAASPGAEAVAP